jgi:hypothetical protein
MRAGYVHTFLRAPLHSAQIHVLYRGHSQQEFGLTGPFIQQGSQTFALRLRMFVWVSYLGGVVETMALFLTLVQHERSLRIYCGQFV